MDEFGSATQSFADLASVPEGTRVVGADGAKLGEVIAVYRGYLIVERGFFFPTDFYVPFEAVAAHRPGAITLALSRNEALVQGWTIPPVDEVLPDPIAPAPQQVPPDQPTAPAPMSPRLTKSPPTTAAEPLPAPAVPREPPSPSHPPANPPVPAAEVETAADAAPESTPPLDQESASPPFKSSDEALLDSSGSADLAPSEQPPSAAPVSDQGVARGPETDEAQTDANTSESPVTEEASPPETPSPSPFAATPSVTTDRATTLSRLFPDLIAPSEAGDTSAIADAAAQPLETPAEAPLTELAEPTNSSEPDGADEETASSNPKGETPPST